MHDAGYVPDIKYMLHDVQRKRNWCFSSITIARNWLLHFGLFSTPPSTLDSLCITEHPCGRYVLTAVLQQSSLQNYLGELWSIVRYAYPIWITLRMVNLFLQGLLTMPQPDIWKMRSAFFLLVDYVHVLLLHWHTWWFRVCVLWKPSMKYDRKQETCIVVCIWCKCSARNWAQIIWFDAALQYPCFQWSIWQQDHSQILYPSGNLWHI